MWKVQQIFLAVVLLQACKPIVSNQPTDQAVVIVPKLISDTNTKPEIDRGLIEFDDHGKMRHRLVLVMDVLGGVDKQNTGLLPRCMQVLTGTQKLGKAYCEKGGAGEADITTDQVDQACYTNPSFKGVSAEKKIVLQGCKAARLRIYKFEPQLQVDIEKK